MTVQYKASPVGFHSDVELDSRLHDENSTIA
jgi:hypothetical protein